MSGRQVIKMDGGYRTVREAAKFLGKSETTIRNWRRSGKLPGLMLEGKQYIPQDALEFWKRFGSEGVTRLGSADSQIARRAFLALTLGTFVATLAQPFISARLEFQEAERRFREARAKEYVEARAVFSELFEARLGPVRSASSGRKYFSKARHQDNRAAADAILPLLGLADPDAIVVPQWADLEIDPRGDVILIGGPNSTPLTKIAWEFEGPDDRHLTRPQDAIVPLRFYGISDVDDPSMKRDVPIGWKMENVGPVATVNWYIIDTKHPRRTRRPVPSTEEVTTIKGQRGYVPRDNYLLITSLPNFLSPDFRDFQRLNPAGWPHILVMEGNHGLGTRAVELLLTAEGLKPLQEAKAALKGAREFQVMFHVSGIEESEGFHRFTKVKLDEDGVEPLDHIGIDVYEKANESAVKRMAALGLGPQ